MSTIYYRYPDTGAIGERSAPGDQVPDLPAGAVEITEAEYEQASADIDDGYTDLDDQEHEERQADALFDYDALLQVGLPEPTARRLSGYDPESPGSPGESPGPLLRPGT